MHALLPWPPRRRDDLVEFCVDQVEAGFEEYYQHTNGNPLVYDTVRVEAFGLEDGCDRETIFWGLRGGWVVCICVVRSFDEVSELARPLSTATRGLSDFLISRRIAERLIPTRLVMRCFSGKREENYSQSSATKPPHCMHVCPDAVKHGTKMK